jgi:hypothetical protein
MSAQVSGLTALTNGSLKDQFRAEGLGGGFYMELENRTKSSGRISGDSASDCERPVSRRAYLAVGARLRS